MTTLTPYKYDVLIIGCGTAGLSLALRLPSSLSICILAKSDIKDSSSYLAQGGISAAISDNDSLESHVQDTLDVGSKLCSTEAVNAIVREGPESIRWLQEIGVTFTSHDTESKQTLHLTREGGHSRRRVVHSQDRTGIAVQSTLLKCTKTKDNITFIFDSMAVDLICVNAKNNSSQQCVGAYIFNLHSNSIDVIPAHTTVLATGGAGKVYLYTSNPDSASGDGIAMAWRAGCSITNMEFMQFHPSCLYHTKAKTLLLSEALRGEGAKLLLPDGKEFMHKVDARGVLAPRDIIARTIDYEMKRLGIDYVLLDISHKSKPFILQHFPTLYQKCLDYGYDMALEAIPIVPAAHYTCGGISINLQTETDLSGLYAIGETAYSGLHGANRMASNSLLECLVLAKFCATSIPHYLKHVRTPQNFSDWDESQVIRSNEEVMVSHNWDELRRIMWNYVGIVRTEKRLLRAKQRIELLKSEVNEHYRKFRVNRDLLELRNLVTVAELIVNSASLRHESRGLHYMQDYPETNPESDGVNTVLYPSNFRGKEILSNKYKR